MRPRTNGRPELGSKGLLRYPFLAAALTCALHLHGQTPGSIAQQAYLKASNTGAADRLGSSVAVSGDTVVVGAPCEDSNGTGVNGNQANNSATNSGAVYIFVRSGTNWVHQAYLKASNTEADDQFGSTVAVDGDTVVVGAFGEDSSATGANGNQTSNNATNSGAAYVFVRTGTNWAQQAYLKASNTGLRDFFGGSVAVAGDTIVIGAYNEESGATGLNGDQNNNSAPFSGAAYIFVRSGTNWTQEAYLKASNATPPGTDQFFGWSVSASGNTVVVGAVYEDSNTGDSGAAYVFVRTGTNWAQQAYLKASNQGESDWFGSSAAVSGDTVVIGALAESSNATGVNGNQSNNSAPFSGAAYVFVRNGTKWSQQAYLKASNTGMHDSFGQSLGISGDTIVIAAPNESSNAAGVNGNQSDNSAFAAGATYVFVRNGTNWTQQAYLKASNTEAGDTFGNGNFGNVSGTGAAVSGSTVVLGAPNESSSATGINGNQSNNNASQAGAVYIFTGVGPFRPELRLTATRNGDMLHLTATGPTNTQWRLEFCDALTGTNSWQPLTNITLGVSATVIQQPFTSISRFYRGAWVP